MCISELPLNIISDERFYRLGGRLEGKGAVNSNGATINNIDSDRRGFFLWLYAKPEPLKSLKNTSTTRKSKDRYEVASLNTTFKPREEMEIFQISGEVLKKLTIWLWRLCHPSTDQLRWTKRNTVGIDLNVFDLEYLPCEACDMG